MQHGIHHLSKRKKSNKFPHKEPFKKFIDYAIYFFAIFAPMMTIPQIYKIWSTGNAAGVSAVSWGAFMINGMFWTSYGIVHKDKPIIITNILWVILNFSVMLGAIIYG